MRFGVIDLIDDTEIRHGQTSDRGQHRVGRNHEIALCRDQLHLGVQCFLLCVQNVQQRALADAFFLAHAGKRGAGCRHLRPVRDQLRAGRNQLRPSRHYASLRLRAVLLDLLHATDVGVLGLTHARLRLAGRVERHGYTASHRGNLLLVDQLRRVVAMRIVGFDLYRRQQFAPGLVDIVTGRLLTIERANNRRVLLAADRNGVLE